MQIFKGCQFVKREKLVNFSIWWGFRDICNFAHCYCELKCIKQFWRAFWQDLLKNLNVYSPCVSTACLPYGNTWIFAKEVYIKVYNVALLVKQLETT